MRRCQQIKILFLNFFSSPISSLESHDEYDVHACMSGLGLCATVAILPTLKREVGPSSLYVCPTFHWVSREPRADPD